MIWFILILALILAWIVLRQYKFIQQDTKIITKLLARCVELWTALKVAEKRVEDLQKVEVENEHLRMVLDKWAEPLLFTEDAGEDFTHDQVLGGRS
jgi:hypothetical protein